MFALRALTLHLPCTLPQVSYVESKQRYGIIEAVIHLVNRDFVALADLYKRLGFIPQEQVGHSTINSIIHSFLAPYGAAWCSRN